MTSLVSYTTISSFCGHRKAAVKKKSGLCWGFLDWLKLHLPHLFILVLYNEFHDFYDERFKKKL